MEDMKPILIILNILTTLITGIMMGINIIIKEDESKSIILFLVCVAIFLYINISK